MNDLSPLARLQVLSDSLTACRRGELAAAALAQSWRAQGLALPLSGRYHEVLGGLLDRLEAGALFQEESCSFSQHDLLESLQLWLDKARLQLSPSAA